MRFSKEFLRGLPKKGSSVAQWMADLYHATAADGTLHLLAPYEFASATLLTCRMEWGEDAFLQSAADFDRLHAAAKAIAPHWDALQETGADPAAILQDEAVVEVYRTYFASLDKGGFDSDKAANINFRVDSVRFWHNLKDQIDRGVPMDEAVLDRLCEDYGTITVSEEERAYLAAYNVHMEAQAARLVGDGYNAYNRIVGLRRLCRLYSLGAPEIVICNEQCDFATTFLLHRHATSVRRAHLDYDECAFLDKE